MASKVKLGQRPATIKSTVRFKMPDGEEGVIACEFKYRTREEFAKFIDQLTKDAVKRADAEVEAAVQAAEVQEQVKLPASDAAEVAEEVAQPADAFSMQRIIGKTTEQNVIYLRDVLKSWDIEGAELNEENLTALANEQPAAVAAIMAGYHDACTQGRLGN